MSSFKAVGFVAPLFNGSRLEFAADYHSFGRTPSLSFTLAFRPRPGRKPARDEAMEQHRRVKALDGRPDRPDTEPPDGGRLMGLSVLRGNG